MKDDHVIYEGFLVKKGGGTSTFGRKNWKKRYFRLYPKYLRYFPNHDDREWLGQVSLRGCKLLEEPTDRYSRVHDYMLVLNSEARELQIRADEKSYDKWKKVLLEAIIKFETAAS